jgi:hypothetical protein
MKVSQLSLSAWNCRGLAFEDAAKKQGAPR